MIALRTRDEILNIGRWTRKRWDELMLAIDNGHITKAEACARYAIGDDEFVWKWLDYERRRLSVELRRAS